MKKIFIITAAVLLTLSSCKKDNIIKEFDPMCAFKGKQLAEMEFDMTKAVFKGLCLPAEDSLFTFDFRINNRERKKYYYKIFYQNISYAFEDSHPLSYENFYGSWEDTRTTFKPVTAEYMKDAFQITGNPRNEQRYYGQDFPRQYKDKDIQEGFKVIESDRQWYESIKKKAKDGGVPLDEQMYKDLMWNMEHFRDSHGDINRRERRNPRTGIYEFMLVVADSEALKQIPYYIKDISKTKDGKFVNPFDYFLNKEGKNIKGVYTCVSKKQLKAKAQYDLSKGVYINRASYPYRDFKVFEGNPNVGNTDSLYRYAQFEEFYHNINTERNIAQVQKIADIQGNGYTLNDYIKDMQNTSLVKKNIHPVITDYPGRNIRCINNTIEIINPANTDIAKARKENTGIKGRIGFTYGRYIYKIKFPALLNKSGLWTGLTDAAWLIYQNSSPWNNRRKSEKGYVKENYNENETERINDTHYSEIDIEMIKTSPFWPWQSKKSPSVSEIQKNKNFVLATTNWDLADGDNTFIAKNTSFTKPYQKKNFTYNRWTKNSRNLTSRVEISNDIFDEPFYYYVIEWKPKEIIWYIGKDLNHLNIVGYMSDEFSSIPNNQMVPVITQEYHYSEFWPPVIYEQGMLPYNSEDIKGIIYGLTIE